MTRVFFLLFMVFLCPILLKAQSNYKPGYVVTLEGDTLRGYINYKEWDYTPAAVTFKEDIKSGGEKVFDASNTSYFEITGMEAYQRHEGPITMNPIAIDRISFQAKTILEPALIFLKVNYQGELVDLLSYSDKIKTRFFFKEKGGSQPQELYYHKYYAASNSSQVVVQKGYVGQLQFLINKYDVSTAVLNREIEAVQYADYDLEKLFGRINEIRVSKPAPADRKGNNSVRYFAGLALNGSKVKFSGITGLHVPERNPISFMPRISFGTDIFLNRHIQKLYFRVEGALTAANYHADNEIDQEQNNYRFSYKISQQSFSLSPQLIYSLYNTDNFKFHLGLVGQISLSAYSKNVFRQDYTYTYQYVSDPPRHESVEHIDYLKLEPLWFTYAFRAGAVLNKKYELYALFAPYASITPYYAYNIEVGSLYIGMNYLFSK